MFFISLPAASAATEARAQATGESFPFMVELFDRAMPRLQALQDMGYNRLPRILDQC